MTFVDILFILVLIFLIGYVGWYVLRNRNSKNIDALEERKEEIKHHSSVPDKLFALKTMELSGQTKRQYENLNSQWQKITNFEVSDVETAISSVRTTSSKFGVLSAGNDIKTIENELDKMEQSVAKLEQELIELENIHELNQAENTTLLERYNEARKRVLNHSLDYGPAIETLETNLHKIEENFEKYNELMNAGDYLQAAESQKTIESDLSTLEEVLEKIPSMYDLIKNRYEVSVIDLREGYDQMVEEHFLFDSDNIPEQIDAIQEDLNQAKVDIKNATLVDAQTLMDKSEREIESLYNYMTAESDAKKYVYSNREQLRKKFDAVTENNHYAIVEVDRISQSYILHGNEGEKIRAYQQDIQSNYDQMVHLEERLEQNDVIYTKAAAQIDKIDQNITEIDANQTAIVKDLSQLSREEKDAKSNLDLYELDLRNMKRRLEKQNLPGLAESYYNMFYKVTDEIEYLSHQLNQVKVDMRQVTQLEFQLEENINKLDEMTEKILDSAILTEYMIQHSNRFRFDHPQMDEAIREAEYLFYELFNYEEALSIIERALYRIDPDGPTQVRRMYHQEKQHRVF